MQWSCDWTSGYEIRVPLSPFDTPSLAQECQQKHTPALNYTHNRLLHVSVNGVAIVTDIKCKGWIY